MGLGFVRVQSIGCKMHHPKKRGIWHFTSTWSVLNKPCAFIISLMTNFVMACEGITCFSSRRHQVTQWCKWRCFGFCEIKLSSWQLTYPLKSRHFWVDDFPNLPFGGICIRSLEGPETSCESKWRNTFTTVPRKARRQTHSLFTKENEKSAYARDLQVHARLWGPGVPLVRVPKKIPNLRVNSIPHSPPIPKVHLYLQDSSKSVYFLWWNTKEKIVSTPNKYIPWT